MDMLYVLGWAMTYLIAVMLVSGVAVYLVAVVIDAIAEWLLKRYGR